MFDLFRINYIFKKHAYIYSFPSYRLKYILILVSQDLASP